MTSGAAAELWLCSIFKTSHLGKTSSVITLITDIILLDNILFYSLTILNNITTFIHNIISIIVLVEHPTPPLTTQLVCTERQRRRNAWKLATSVNLGT